MSTTLDYLHESYGPLMSMEALAKTFDRSREGLRVCLASQSDFSVAINAAKKKYGRRVFFKTELIAEIIDNDDYV